MTFFTFSPAFWFLRSIATFTSSAPEDQRHFWSSNQLCYNILRPCFYSPSSGFLLFVSLHFHYVEPWRTKNSQPLSFCSFLSWPYAIFGERSHNNTEICRRLVSERCIYSSSFSSRARWLKLYSDFCISHGSLCLREVLSLSPFTISLTPVDHRVSVLKHWFLAVTPRESFFGLKEVHGSSCICLSRKTGSLCLFLLTERSFRTHLYYCGLPFGRAVSETRLQSFGRCAQNL